MHGKHIDAPGPGYREENRPEQTYCTQGKSILSREAGHDPIRAWAGVAGTTILTVCLTVCLTAHLTVCLKILVDKGSQDVYTDSH